MLSCVLEALNPLNLPEGSSLKYVARCTFCRTESNGTFPEHFLLRSKKPPPTLDPKP